MAIVIVAGLLFLGAGALVIVQHITLTNGLDANLTQRADGLQAQFELSGLPNSLPGADDDAATQLVDASGLPAVWSANIEGAAPLADDPGATTTIEQRSLPMAENDAFRVLSRRVAIDGSRFVLHVAAASDDVSDSVRTLAISLAVAVPLALVALGAVVWWLVGRALGSVEAIRSEVASIRSDELHRRVPVPEDDDEISALARTMNAMLARVEGGVARQQAFAADASHELRSPLTRMRSELEVELAAANDADVGRILRSVLEEASEMEHLLSDLLYLARSDAGDQPMRATTLDLDDVVLEEIGKRRGAERIAIDASSVSAAQVWGDPIQLARAVGNLLDNAIRHARQTVSIGLEEAASEAVLSIADDGPGIPAGEVDRIFERFARIDEGRSRNEGGTGLGLSITADIVSRHHGSIRVDTTIAAGARFEVRLPLQATPAS